MYEQERQQLLDAVAQFMLQTGCAYFAIPADSLMRGAMLAFGDGKFVQDQIEHLTVESAIPDSAPLVFTRRGNIEPTRKGSGVSESQFLDVPRHDADGVANN